MYIFNRITKDVKDVQKRQRIVAVEFVDGTEIQNKENSFSLDTSVESIKKYFKEYLDELNATLEVITDIDYVAPDTTPTATEQAEIDWWQDWNKLQTVERLIQSGILVGDEAPVVALKNKVKTNFKASYIA